MTDSGAKPAAHPASAPTIAVIGAGGVGAVLAAELVTGGHRVTLCARTPFESLLLESADVRREIAVPISTDPAAQPVADVVVLATKVGDTQAAAPWLAALVDEHTVVVAAQNGIDHEHRVGQYTSAPVVPALLYVAAERVHTGHIIWHSGREIRVGTGESARRVGDLFTQTTLRVRHEPDMRTAVWRKLLSNIGANPITALTLRRMDVLAEPGIQELATGLLQEAVAVARAAGANLPIDEADEIVRLWSTFDTNGGSSMLYDRLAGRGLEHEYLTGAVVDYAARHGIDVPLNRGVLALLRALDTSGAA